MFWHPAWCGVGATPPRGAINQQIVAYDRPSAFAITPIASLRFHAHISSNAATAIPGRQIGMPVVQLRCVRAIKTVVHSPAESAHAGARGVSAELHSHSYYSRMSSIALIHH